MANLKKSEKAKRIFKILNSLYPKPKVPLDYTNSYSLLIATVLSAQCTDIRVNKVTPLLFKSFDTMEKIADANSLDIKEIIRSCGLSNSKSKAIVELSKLILKKHNGHVPSSFEKLEELPGVGHKTASVVMAQAFGVPAFPVDTHIHRLATRWGLTNGKSVVQTERDLKSIFDEQQWNKLHLQIIYFGRQYCPARGHNVEKCPVCSWAMSKEAFSKEAFSKKSMLKKSKKN